MEKTKIDTDYHAILIGINAYPKPLKGCINDVQEIENYLKTLSTPVQIRILTAAEPCVERNGEQVNEYPLRPTYENVRSIFRQTISSAKAGDFVYIHFSGHGTRVKSSDEFSNQSSGDLALVLLEKDTGVEEQYLRGSELAFWLKGMVDKGLTVTLVLDCCFSATVYRYDDPDVRYLPYNVEADSRHPLNLGESLSVLPKLSTSRDVSMLPNWLIDPDKYTIVVACGPDQEAKELETHNDRRHGILSFFLLDAWRRNGGIKRKHKTIFYHVCAETRKCGCRQQPILYGNKEQGFFGLQNSTNERTLIAVSQDREGNRNLVMQAGRAHGIHLDDELDIFQPGSVQSSFEPEAILLTAKVTQVRGLSADLELLNADLISNDADWAAEVRATAAFCRYRIKVLSDVPHKEELVNTLQARSFTVSIDEDNQPCSFGVTLDKDGRYTVFDRFGQTVINLPDMGSGLMDTDGICDIVEHLTRYDIVRGLGNEAQADSSFQESFDVYITDPTGCSHCPGDLVTVSSGEVRALVMRNKSDRTLYVFAYGMGPAWHIESLLKGTCEVVPPRDPSRGFTGVFRKKIKMTVPQDMVNNGHHECEDLIKVIVTDRSTSFDLLELPKLGQAMNKKKQSNRMGYGDAYGASDDWAALTFPIRTYCQ